VDEKMIEKVVEMVKSDDEDVENAGPWAPVKESKQELGAAAAEEEKTPAPAVEDSEPIDPSVQERRSKKKKRRKTLRSWKLPTFKQIDLCGFTGKNIDF
jgi:hypothetical protein